MGRASPPLEAGLKKNRLTFTGETRIGKFSTGTKKKELLLKCDCGEEKWIGHSNFVSGCTKSCGCLARENRQRLKKQFII